MDEIDRQADPDSGGGHRLLPPLWSVAVALTCVAVIAGYRLVAALWPSLGDAALFFYFGRRLNEGAQLYVDIWDLKPPVIFLVNALAARFGNAFAAIAGIEILVLVVAGALLARTLRLAGAQPAALAAALLFYAALVSFEPVAEGSNYTEIYVIPLAVLSMYLFTSGLRTGRRGGSLFAGAGAAACIAAWAKLPGLAPLLAELAFLAAMLLVPGRRAPAAAAMLWCLGGFLACLGAVLAVAALTTDLTLLIDGGLIHPIHYAKRPIPGSGFTLGEQMFVVTALAIPLLLAAAAAIVAALGLAQAARRGADGGSGLPIPSFALHQYCGLFALWAFADLAGALGTGRHYGHYFLPFAASGAAASAMAMTWARTARPRLGALPLALFALSLGVLALNGVRTTYWRVSGPPGAEAALQAGQKPVLAALRARAAPGATLVTWNNMHGLYLLSGLANATPHLALLNGIDSERAERTKAPALLRQLRRCPATFVVMSSDVRPYSPASRAFERGIRTLLADSYRSVPLGSGAAGIELFEHRRGVLPCAVRRSSPAGSRGSPEP